MPLSHRTERVAEQIREEEEGLEADARVVNLMTVHQAKGMEWPVVFVAGVTDRSWPMRGFPVEVGFFEEGGASLRRHVIGYEENGQLLYEEHQLHQNLAADEEPQRHEEERRVRLDTARVELAAAEEFDATVVNDDVRRAAAELVSLMGSPVPEAKRD